VCLQILHTISNHQLELVNSMAPYMESTVLPILKETTTMWQPTDFLPDSSSDTFIDEASTRTTLPSDWGGGTRGWEARQSRYKPLYV